MLCKNCGVNEREEPFGWCSDCLDTPREPIDRLFLIEGYKGKRIDRAKGRRAWRKAYKSPIPHGWHIHHIDGNPENCDPTNLLCVSVDQHIKIHEANGDGSAVTILKRQFKWNLHKQKLNVLDS